MSAQARGLIVKQSARPARQNVAVPCRLTTLLPISDNVRSNTGRSLARDNVSGGLSFMSASSASLSNCPARTPRWGVFA